MSELKEEELLEAVTQGTIAATLVVEWIVAHTQSEPGPGYKRYPKCDHVVFGAQVMRFIQDQIAPFVIGDTADQSSKAPTPAMSSPSPAASPATSITASPSPFPSFSAIVSSSPFPSPPSFSAVASASPVTVTAVSHAALVSSRNALFEKTSMRTVSPKDAVTTVGFQEASTAATTATAHVLVPHRKSSPTPKPAVLVSKKSPAAPVTASTPQAIIAAANKKASPPVISYASKATPPQDGKKLFSSPPPSIGKTATPPAQRGVGAKPGPSQESATAGSGSKKQTTAATASVAQVSSDTKKPITSQIPGKQSASTNEPKSPTSATSGENKTSKIAENQPLSSAQPPVQIAAPASIEGDKNSTPPSTPQKPRIAPEIPKKTQPEDDTKQSRSTARDAFGVSELDELIPAAVNSQLPDHSSPQGSSDSHLSVVSDRLNGMAMLFYTIVARKILPNTGLALVLLCKLLMVNIHNDFSSSSVVFRNGTDCVLFACYVLGWLEPLTCALGQKALRLMADNKTVKQVAPRFHERVANWASQVESEDTSNVFGEEEILGAVHEFSAKTDSRHNFKSPAAAHMYNNREQSKDAFLALVKEFHSQWRLFESHASEPKLRVKCQEFFAFVHPGNVSWFVVFFINQLLQQTWLAESQANEGRKLAKLRAFEYRLSNTPNPLASASPADVQEVFHSFLVYLDSYSLNSLLISALVEKITTLLAEVSPSTTTQAIRPLSPQLIRTLGARLLKLKILAKFLGFLVFSPNYPFSASPIKDEGMQQALQVANRSQPQFDVGQVLQKMPSDGMVLILPWVAEYLSMMRGDEVSKRTDYYQAVFKTLFKFHYRLDFYQHKPHLMEAAEESCSFNMNMLCCSLALEDLFNALKIVPRRVIRRGTTTPRTPRGSPVLRPPGSPSFHGRAFDEEPATPSKGRKVKQNLAESFGVARNPSYVANEIDSLDAVPCTSRLILQSVHMQDILRVLSRGLPRAKTKATQKVVPATLSDSRPHSLTTQLTAPQESKPEALEALQKQFFLQFPSWSTLVTFVVDSLSPNAVAAVSRDLLTETLTLAKDQLVSIDKFEQIEPGVHRIWDLLRDKVMKRGEDELRQFITTHSEAAVRSLVTGSRMDEQAPIVVRITVRYAMANAFQAFSAQFPKTVHEGLYSHVRKLLKQNLSEGSGAPLSRCALVAKVCALLVFQFPEALKEVLDQPDEQISEEEGCSLQDTLRWFNSLDTSPSPSSPAPSGTLLAEKIRRFLSQTHHLRPALHLETLCESGLFPFSASTSLGPSGEKLGLHLLLLCRMTLAQVLADMLYPSVFEQRLVQMLSSLHKRFRESSSELEFTFSIRMSEAFGAACTDCVAFFRSHRTDQQPLLFTRLMAAVQYYAQAKEVKDDRYGYDELADQKSTQT